MPEFPRALWFAVAFGLAANVAAAAGLLPGLWILFLPLGNLALMGAGGWVAWRWLGGR